MLSTKFEAQKKTTCTETTRGNFSIKQAGAMTAHQKFRTVAVLWVNYHENMSITDIFAVYLSSN
jgi:hypothetical protein